MPRCTRCGLVTATTTSERLYLPTVRESQRRGESEDYAGETEWLRRELSHHLRDRPLSDRDNWRLQNELGWQDDRGNLLGFLDDPGIELTNNRTERVLRGSVIARKVSHCSRTEAGADALSAFIRVFRTLARHDGGQLVADGLCGVFSGSPVHARPSEHPSTPLPCLR